MQAINFRQTVVGGGYFQWTYWETQQNGIEKIDKEACTYGKYLGYQYRHEIGRDYDRGCVGQKAREQRNQEPEISSGPQLAPGFPGESRQRVHDV